MESFKSNLVVEVGVKEKAGLVLRAKKRKRKKNLIPSIASANLFLYTRYNKL